MARADADLSQTQLADALGVSLATCKAAKASHVGVDPR
jgi:DNA-binding XRE family transcriptional regulator